MIVLAGQSNANHPDTLAALSDGVYPWGATKAAWNGSPLAPVREDGSVSYTHLTLPTKA